MLVNKTLNNEGFLWNCIKKTYKIPVNNNMALYDRNHPKLT